MQSTSIKTPRGRLVCVENTAMRYSRMVDVCTRHTVWRGATMRLVRFVQVTAISCFVLRVGVRNDRRSTSAARGRAKALVYYNTLYMTLQFQARKNPTV